MKKLHISQRQGIVNLNIDMIDPAADIFILHPEITACKGTSKQCLSYCSNNMDINTNQITTCKDTSPITVR